jgi:hypothetical protein
MVRSLVLNLSRAMVRSDFMDLSLCHMVRSSGLGGLWIALGQLGSLPSNGSFLGCGSINTLESLTDGGSLLERG